MRRILALAAVILLLGSAAYAAAPTKQLPDDLTLADNQSLLINRSTSESDLNILLASAGEYMLSSDKAESIITEVKTAMMSWRAEARRLGLPQRDIDMFAPRFDKWIE